MINDTKLHYSILFVDDEEKTRKNYVNYLKRYYDVVYEAEDGMEAYELYITHKPQILILDINMPKMNGLALLEKIRQRDQNTRCIMLTAHTDKEFLLWATRLKLTDYLVKPLKRASLKEALVKVVDELERYDVVEKNTIVFGDGCSWNMKKSILIVDGSTIVMTSLEIKLLQLFFKNINMNLVYDDIIIYLWDTFENDKKDALKTLIKKLRKKLPKDLIQNIYGMGYKLAL